LVDTRPCGYVTAQWITNFRIYLQRPQCTIQSSQIGTQERLRQNDDAIMEIISPLQLHSRELKLLNNVRTYLQVTTIAEISTNGGDKIHPAYSENQPPKTRPTQQGRSLLLWPPQPPPTPRLWRQWTKHLQTICKPTSWMLKKPLGPWIHNHSQHRTWYGQVANNIVFTSKTCWTKQRQKHTKNIYARSETTTPPLITTPFIPYDISDTYITEDKHTRAQTLQVEEENLSTIQIPDQSILTNIPVIREAVILIGFHYTRTTGAVFWELHRPNQQPQIQSTTLPNIRETTPKIATTIGIIHCIQYMFNSQQVPTKVVIQTTP
jgi:hypothetical protein